MVDIFGGDFPGVRIKAIHLGSKALQQLSEKANIRKIGDIPENALLLGEERCRHDGQGGIFGTTDGEGTLQGVPSFNSDNIHGKSG